MSVTNLGSVPIQLVLSHQEAFPLHPPDSVGTHVELVAGIQPEEVSGNFMPLYKSLDKVDVVLVFFMGRGNF